MSEGRLFRTLLARALALLHCCLLCFASNFSTSTDGQALLAFKAGIQTDPSNVLATNWSTATSFCNWIGVSCSPRHGRVTALSLPNMGLNGTITPFIGNLSFLVSLDLTNNSLYGNLPHQLGDLPRLKAKLLAFNGFSGRIPEEIGRLSQLQFLNLTANQLSGSIPQAIFNISTSKGIGLSINSLSGSLPDDFCYHLPVLTELRISSNSLSGTIPSSLQECKMLRILWLNNNELTGNIPKELANITTLEQIDLGHNILQGEIPGELGNLYRLVIFAVQDNYRLTGSIPSGIFNISSLTDLILSNNSFSGSLPMDLCHSMPNLEHLYLYNNEFVGSIPIDIGNCTMLKQLRLGINNFSGDLPESMGNLQYLEVLRIPSNKFTGTIPPSIFNSSTVKLIALADNRLSGNLPSDIGLHLPVLLQLLLGGNELSGIVPCSISNASNLVIIDLSENLFRGFIPLSFGDLEFLQFLGLSSNNFISDPSTPELNFITSLTKCRQLTTLLVDNNNGISGIIPTSIGNLSTTMQVIDASYCRIIDKIPSVLGNLSNLISLSLGDNELTGPIPETLRNLAKIQSLNLSGNNIQESIPSDLCYFLSLGTLSLSRNRISGPIPACVGNLTSLRILFLDSNELSSMLPSTIWTLRDLLRLNLSSNLLTGNLPPEIGNLKVISQLELSNNNFSGGIRNEIGDLQQLVRLSLAHNEFQGAIPESFGSIVNLEFLDLSHNNLSGAIPMSLEELSYLSYLNLSYNILEGEIPSKGPFTKFTAQSFMNNAGLCGPSKLEVPPCKPKNSKKPLKAGIFVLKYVLPVIVVALLALAFVLLLVRRKRTKEKNPAEATSLPIETYRRISHRELMQATDGYDESSLLGRGSFSSVYKGVLSDGMVVAIKVFNLQLEGAFRSFDSECEVIRNIRHRNLIKIVGSCTNVDFKALVMEYMPNGSLEMRLHSQQLSLDILERLNILVDVALSLEYLHHGLSAPIVHCDIKPSNVLLDKDMVAHLGDYGISKLLGESISMIQTKTLATIGYMAPEYGSQGIVSTSCDIYSFGILMMETFTRKKPTDQMFDGEMSLKHWVHSSLSTGILEVIDPSLLSAEDTNFAAKDKCFLSLMRLAVECCEESPETRIDIRDVLHRLKHIKDEFPGRA